MNQGPTVESRLDRLERENRRWRYATIAALTTIGLMLICGAQGARDKDARIETNEIRVLDQEGKPRITLGGSPELGQSLYIKDEIGIPQIGITLQPRGRKSISLVKLTKTIMGTMLMEEDGSFGLSYNGPGQPGFTLGTFGGQPFLRLWDKADKVRAKLGLDADGTPSLELYDKAEKVRAKLGLDADGAPAISFYDQAEKLTDRIPAR